MNIFWSFSLNGFEFINFFYGVTVYTIIVLSLSVPILFLGPEVHSPFHVSRYSVGNSSDVVPSSQVTLSLFTALRAHYSMGAQRLMLAAIEFPVTK